MVGCLTVARVRAIGVAAIVVALSGGHAAGAATIPFWFANFTPGAVQVEVLPITLVDGGLDVVGEGGSTGDVEMSFGPVRVRIEEDFSEIHFLTDRMPAALDAPGSASGNVVIPGVFPTKVPFEFVLHSAATDVQIGGSDSLDASGGFSGSTNLPYSYATDMTLFVEGNAIPIPFERILDDPANDGPPGRVGDIDGTSASPLTLEMFLAAGGAGPFTLTEDTVVDGHAVRFRFQISFDISGVSTAVAPEPAFAGLALLGVVGFGLAFRRCR